MYAHIHPGAHTSAAAASAHSDQRIIPRFTARTALQISAIRIAILKCSRLIRLLLREALRVYSRGSKRSRRGTKISGDRVVQKNFPNFVFSTLFPGHPCCRTPPLSPGTSRNRVGCSYFLSANKFARCCSFTLLPISLTLLPTEDCFISIPTSLHQSFL